MLTKIDSWKLENFLSNRRCFSLKKHVFHCLFSRLFEHDFNSTGTSTSPKRSVNELNAMLNVLLFSSHYTAHTEKSHSHAHGAHYQFICSVARSVAIVVRNQRKIHDNNNTELEAFTLRCIRFHCTNTSVHLELHAARWHIVWRICSCIQCGNASEYQTNICVRKCVDRRINILISKSTVKVHLY